MHRLTFREAANGSNTNEPRGWASSVLSMHLCRTCERPEEALGFSRETQGVAVAQSNFIRERDDTVEPMKLSPPWKNAGSWGRRGSETGRQLEGLCGLGLAGVAQSGLARDKDTYSALARKLLNQLVD